jgi:capsular polysaccharide biosynthesis protein
VNGDASSDKVTYKNASFNAFKSRITTAVQNCTHEIIQRHDEYHAHKANEIVNEIKGSIVKELQKITEDLKFVGTF